jgi:hypothetical protein
VKVKMRQMCAGPAGVWAAGQIVNVTPQEAADLVKAGAAEALEKPPALPRSTVTQTGGRSRGGAAAAPADPKTGKGGGAKGAGKGDEKPKADAGKGGEKPAAPDGGEKPKA